MGFDINLGPIRLPDPPPFGDFTDGTGNGDGGGNVEGQSGNYGGSTPDWTPTTGVGIAWDTSTTPDTEWNYHDGAWH